MYLAYTLDDNFKDETIIPKGARSQSIPGPGELPQSFETSEVLKARAQWNNLKARTTKPQTPDTIDLDRETPDQRTYTPRVYLKGIATNLKPNDPLLIDFLGSGTPTFYRVKEVKPDAAADRTLVTLQAHLSQPSQPTGPVVNLISALTLPPSVQLASSLRLERDLESLFRGSGIARDIVEPELTCTQRNRLASDLLRESLVGGEASHTALKAFAPVLRETLATAATNAQAAEKNLIRVYTLRNKAPLFGHNMPLPNSFDESPTGGHDESSTKDDKSLRTLALDAEYKEIKIGDWVAIEKKDNSAEIVISQVENVSSQTLGGNQSGELAFFTTRPPETKTTTDGVISTSTAEPILIKSTVVKLKKKWREDNASQDLLRRTNVYFHSEELELAEEPIEESVCGGTDQLLELNGLYEGLESGRWVVVSGEREIAGTSGVRFSELAMLSVVTQKALPGLADDRLHSFIALYNKLEYCFKRDTVTIYGNVVKATHGEARREVLGSGDGAKPLQSFVLKQPPLTYVSASNPSGVDSTLRVYVNDVQWRETDSLAGLSPTDRNFITKTDDDGKTTVVFGNGREGARLPTGIENIKAEYRNGIGKPGNVKAGQITLLTTRPLGVKEVINPLRASGGADKESRDQARKSAPLAVTALDRLVSVQDYEDFARTYAGIGKACAAELSDGRRQVVHVTIAGADDIPIDKNSDLYRNLRQALRDFGDPYQAIELEIRELMLIVISARIRILPEYRWEPVVTQVRAALLDAFGFERRELGQDVLLSEVMSVMQAVRGVAYVDVDAFGGIPEKKLDQGQRRLLTPAEIGNEVQKLVTQSMAEGPTHRVRVNLAGSANGSLQPAQLAFLTPEVPETLILNQIT